MVGKTLNVFECPNCGAKDMSPDRDDRLLCLYCGTSFGDVQRICLECGHYSEAGANYCQECSAPLTRVCPACGAENWIRAEHCTECGRNLDMIGLIAQRLRQTTQERLRERHAGMVAVKEAEERASQQRMAHFLEIERDRQQALAEEEALRARRDRQLVVLVAAGLATLVLLLVAFLVLSSGR